MFDFCAEKKLSLPPAVKTFSEMLFGSTKEIVLIRDPRDIYASRLAYFDLDPEQAFNEISINCNDLVNAKRLASSDSLLFDPSSMIRSPLSFCAELSSFLGVHIPMACDDLAEVGNFKRHGTSASPSSSVGRWVRDLRRTRGSDVAKHGALFWSPSCPKPIKCGYDLP